MKHSLEGLNNRFDKADKRIRNLKIEQMKLLNLKSRKTK